MKQMTAEKSEHVDLDGTSILTKPGDGSTYTFDVYKEKGAPSPSARVKVYSLSKLLKMYKIKKD